MIVARLIELFQSRGFSIWAEGDSIKVSPSSALTGEDRQAIRDHKAELLALLKAESKPDKDKNPETPEGGKAQKAQKSPANQKPRAGGPPVTAGKWKPVTTADVQIAAERHERRTVGEDGRDLPAAAKTPTLDARTKRKPDPPPPDGICPGCAEPPRYQGQNTWWCATCRRWFSIADNRETEDLDGVKASVASEPKAAPTPSAAPERPRLGSSARPMPVQGTKERLGDSCLWSTCQGFIVGRGHTLYECSSCGTWFELLPMGGGLREALRRSEALDARPHSNDYTDWTDVVM